MSNKQRFFNQPVKIILYIKGTRSYYGYRAFRGTIQFIENYSATPFGSNLSELAALNNAIERINTRNTNHHIFIEVRTNSEWLKRIIMGTNTPDHSTNLFEKYMKLTQGLDIKPRWIPTKKSLSKKNPDIDNHLIHAQQILEVILKNIAKHRKEARYTIIKMISNKYKPAI